jgi:hypothetical protein
MSTTPTQTPPETAVHPTAVEEATQEVPEGIEAGRDVAKDIAEGRIPSPEEQARAEAVVESALTLGPQIVKETKAGYKTTEFWFTSVIAILTLVGTFPLPPKFEAVVASGLAAAYTISRGIAKLGVPNVQEPSE